MQELNFKKKGKLHTPLNFWKTDTITWVAIYQGERGERPELDFIVKYKEDNKRLRTPSHTHWIVDLIVKAQSNKELLIDYIDDLIKIYDDSVPFHTTDDRVNYTLKYPDILSKKYFNLDNTGHYSIQTLTSFIELFSKCEKQSSGAYMFKGLLTLVKEYCQGKKDFYQIVGYSKRV